MPEILVNASAKCRGLVRQQQFNSRTATVTFATACHKRKVPDPDREFPGAWDVPLSRWGIGGDKALEEPTTGFVAPPRIASSEQPEASSTYAS